MHNDRSLFPVDPVCGMNVNPAEAAGTASYAGQQYHFCSLKCKATFEASPARFAKPGNEAATAQPHGNVDQQGLTMSHEHHHDNAGGGWSPRSKLAFAVFAGVVAFFLYTEHRAHLFGFLPYLLILACPLMHLFHHGGHGGHGNHGYNAPPQQPPRKET